MKADTTKGSIKIWWQVYIYPKIFGFASVDGVITDAPDWNWKGRRLENMRSWFRENNAQVIKICEQCI